MSSACPSSTARGLAPTGGSVATFIPPADARRIVSGRPISFKMDLYNPLYVDRPVVEPELFVSLCPVAYCGGFGNDPRELNKVTLEFREEEKSLDGLKRDAESLRGLATQLKSGKAKEQAEFGYLGRLIKPNDPNAAHAKDTAAELAQRIGVGTVGNAATAGALGDFFQYVIDHPVTLSRQKSALLLIVGKDIEGSWVSIYNAGVQAKYPLLGLRFKNTSGGHLNQGPITVFEGSTYAGDTRVLDV